VSVLGNIAIFADSSCDFPREYAESQNISLIPLTVSFGDMQYTDGIDIDTATFFKLLKDNPHTLPKTSSPNPDNFIGAFKSVSSDCEDIICFTLTSKSSGTFNSASIAKNMLDADSSFKPRIIIFDTLNASIAIGLIASTASAMAAKGNNLEMIIKRITEMRERTALYFVLDTLEYMRKGGRIGAVKAILGTLLNVKPILTFLNGTPIDIDKCRGIANAQEKLIKLFFEKSANLNEVSIIHASSIDRAKGMAADLERTIANIKVKIFEVGAVMGSYTGAGAIGLAFEEKTARVLPKRVLA
jgi:DegV family protein with EDD domain